MLLADRGYDADWIRAFATERGSWANVPPRCNRREPICYSPHLYRARQAVEYNDTNAIAAVAAKTDDVERQLGVEYDKVLNGLDQIDFSSDEGQQVAATFYNLQQKCEKQKDE